MNKKKNDKKIKWVDTHCHIQHADINIEELNLENIDWLLIPGINLESSVLASNMASSFQSRFLWSAGLHPHEASSLDKQRDKLLELFKQADAIGETGLDYYRNLSNPTAQLRSFNMHVESAIELKKPLIVHCRDSFKDVHKIIEQNNFSAPVVLHSWTGGNKWTKKFIELNVYFSFSGIITYETAKDLQLACEKIPLENILLETDTPYLVPSSIDDKTNQPMYIENTALKVSEIKNIDLERLSNATINNSKKCFIERLFPNE